MKIAAVSFDLTGTLLCPFPSLGDLCVKAMQAQSIAEIPDAALFNERQAVARSRAQQNGHAPVSEERSKDYWRAMLWEIYAGACNNTQFKIAEKFIYDALARPEHWQIMPFVRETLEFLQFLKIPAVVISNGDSRWIKALEDKGLAPFFKKIFVSSQTGLAKPDVAVFDYVCRSLKIARNELLHIGDSIREDVIPATQCGANAFWVSRHPIDFEKLPENTPSFETLENVGMKIREIIAPGTFEISRSRNARRLLAQIDGLPAPDNNSPRLYRALDPQKEIAISPKFIAQSEERRENGDDTVTTPEKIIPELLKKRGFYKGSIQDAVGEIWENAVPATLARRCRPDDLKDNFQTLYVRCENAAVMQEFALQKSRILKRLKEHPACAKLKRLVPVC
ncbi:MAG: HAD-IA family hydrolase [Opitutales bacterium]|nr:HAD-IA family hydrolase [Opitutales bacterium]